MAEIPEGYQGFRADGSGFHRVMRSGAEYLVYDETNLPIYAPQLRVRRNDIYIEIRVSIPAELVQKVTSLGLHVYFMRYAPQYGTTKAKKKRRMKGWRFTAGHQQGDHLRLSKSLPDEGIPITTAHINKWGRLQIDGQDLTVAYLASVFIFAQGGSTQQIYELDATASVPMPVLVTASRCSKRDKYTTDYQGGNAEKELFNGRKVSWSSGLLLAHSADRSKPNLMHSTMVVHDFVEVRPMFTATIEEGGSSVDFKAGLEIKG